MKNILTISVILVFAMSSAEAISTKWVVKSSGESCYIAFDRTGDRAFPSGRKQGKSPFYICSANVKRKGFRGGFNTAAKPQVCYVAYGYKKSVEPHNFTHLCYK